jgi:stage II sporulation protein D
MMGNRNMETKHQNVMLGWMAGMILLVAVLVLFILFHESEPDGITRAAAYKAAALAVTSYSDCVKEADQEPSFFSAGEQGRWYIKYADYLYRHGLLDQESVSPNQKTAEGQLTYGEAELLLEAMAKELEIDDIFSQLHFRPSAKKQEKTVPEKTWWETYETLIAGAEKSEVEFAPLLIYGTPENIRGGRSWTAYTDQGEFGFEGLVMDIYIDREIQVCKRGNEIIRVVEEISSEVVYKNTWIASVDESDKTFTGYVGDVKREFDTKKKLGAGTGFEDQVADLHLRSGKVEKIVLKEERINGKILAVKENSIEVEGYGAVPMDEKFQVYRLYGEFASRTINDLLVGYDALEFAVADGNLCAALLKHPFDADSIRVLIMDDGFQTVFHDQIQLEFLSNGTYRTGEKSYEFVAGETLNVTMDSSLFQNGRVIFEPEDQEKGIRVVSMNRSYGNPVYSGRLEISREDGGLVLVNELYLEDYLKHVVPSEMPVSYEKEALKAQAVCARTYAYRQIQGNSYKEYGAHVDDSTRFQVYNNLETSQASDAAVTETYGKILMYQNSPAEAFYFSTSCGHTTDGTIWGASLSSVPYLKGVTVRPGGGQLDLTDEDTFSSFIKSAASGYESEYAMYRWTTTCTSSQLEQKISGIGSITNLEVTRRSTGGIAVELQVTGTEGVKTVSTESQIRSILGNPELVIKKQDGQTLTGWSSLPSAFLTVEKKKTDENGMVTFAIYGGGYGHGVGMSQNGAQAMAKKGKTYEQILQFFFTGIEIQSLAAD